MCHRTPQANCRKMQAFRFMLISLLFATHQMCVADYAREKNDLDEIQHARVFHIMFSTETEAHVAYRELKDVPVANRLASFKRVAQSKSRDPGSAPSGGDLGIVREGEMGGSFESVFLNQALLEVSSPFKTEFGWHIIYVIERSSLSVARVCDEGLAYMLGTKQHASDRALLFTKRMQRTGELHPGVLTYLGAGWSSPLKNSNGDLVYLRKSSSPVKADVVVIEEHTEFVRPLYNASPPTCKRSQKIVFEVNCVSGTVLPRIREDFEGRAQSGRRLMNLKWPIEKAKIYEMDARLKGQIAKFACTPTL